MKGFLNLLWRPLKLDINTFVAQRNSPDAFKRAFLVVVIVGLFVGLFAGGLQIGGFGHHPLVVDREVSGHRLRCTR